jgi:phosphoribosylglycinamide formyltransferase 1
MLKDKKKKIAILISGNGSNMAAIADSVEFGILRDYYKIVLVISNNSDAPGLEIAKLRKLPVLCIDSKQYAKSDFENALLRSLESYDLNYIILAGYNRILSSAIVSRYEKRIINIHPADTKLYKGLHGYEWAFKEKRDETTITVHWVDEGCDTGEIIAQKNISLKGLKTLEEIKKVCLAVEHEFYSQVLRDLAII